MARQIYEPAQSFRDRRIEGFLQWQRLYLIDPFLCVTCLPDKKEIIHHNTNEISVSLKTHLHAWVDCP